MMSPRRLAASDDLVAVIVGLASLRDRVDAMITDLASETVPSEETCDDDAVDCLLGLAALARSLDIGAVASLVSIEPSVAVALAELLR